MRRWELWGDENGHYFFSEGDEHTRSEAIAEGYELLWECTARGSNEAQQMRYDHLGYGEYEPMLRPDGTPYPEDEDDQFAGPGHV